MSLAGTRLVLLGASGFVGREVLTLALADERVASVVAPSRKPLPRHAKLSVPQVTFADLPDAHWWQADAAICTLGASLMAAGSREEFRRIDHDYVLSAAQRIRDASTPTFVLLSACRAHPRSWFFYTRTKGELEQNLTALGFASLALIRPSMIGGERSPPRCADTVGSILFGALNPVLPRSWRMVHARAIARKLLEVAINPKPGAAVIGVRNLAI